MSDDFSIDDLEKMLRDVKPHKATAAKKRKPKKAAPVRVKNPTPVGKPDDVYMVVDFYCRKGDNIQSLLRDARSEREARNYNVIVNVHSHGVGVECDHLCREVIK